MLCGDLFGASPPRPPWRSYARPHGRNRFWREIGAKNVELWKGPKITPSVRPPRDRNANVSGAGQPSHNRCKRACGPRRQKRRTRSVARKPPLPYVKLACLTTACLTTACLIACLTAWPTPTHRIPHCLPHSVPYADSPYASKLACALRLLTACLTPTHRMLHCLLVPHDGLPLSLAYADSPHASPLVGLLTIDATKPARAGHCAHPHRARPATQSLTPFSWVYPLFASKRLPSRPMKYEISIVFLSCLNLMIKLVLSP